MAVDDYGNALTWNGDYWSAPYSADSDGGINAVSCPSVSFCVAVDGLGGAVTWNGLSWSSPTQVYRPSDFMSVSCPTNSFCMAVDETGNYFTWNSGTWSSYSAVDPAGGFILNSVSCPATSFCMATGDNGEATWNGVAWDPVNNIGGIELNSPDVSCPTVSFCAVVDTQGMAVTWDGSSWQTPALIDSGGYLASISCPSDLFCVAVDTNGYALIGSNFAVPTGNQSTVVLGLSKTKLTYGNEQSEKISVTVTPTSSALTPTGTVKITNSATTLCTITLAAAKGSCLLSATALAAGADNLEAIYNGNSLFVISYSPQTSLLINEATSKTTLKLSATTVTYAKEKVEKLSVSVNPQYKGTPGGTVAVRDSTVTLCVVTLAKGKGSCALSAKQLKPGHYSLVATYAASPTNFKDSASKKGATLVIE
jgi:hypothetical protein